MNIAGEKLKINHPPFDPAHPPAQPGAQPNRWTAGLRLLIGLLIGAGALSWAAAGVEWPAVGRSLAAVSPLWLGTALLGVIGVSVGKAARWQALYRPTSPSPPAFSQCLAVWLTAQTLTSLLPLRVGEVVRLGLMKRSGQPVAITLSTLVVEKALDLMSAGLMAASLLGLAAGPAWFNRAAPGLIALSLVVMVGLLGLWRGQGRAGLRLSASERWLPAGWSRRLQQTGQTFLAALALLSQGRALVPVSLWTLAIWLGSLGTIKALLVAYDLALPLAAAALIMLALLFSNLAPTPPAMLGLIPGIAVAILGPYGVAQPTALGFGLMLNLVIAGPVLLAGSLTLWAQATAVLSLFNRL